MLKAITAINPSGESLRLELGQPEKSGFLVESIDGLGPEKVQLDTTDNALGDGAFLNSAKKSTKSIVLNLKYIWKKNTTIEQLRLITYKFFPLKKQIKLIVESDIKATTIDVYVESNEPDIFSQTSGTAITMTAMFPYFKSSGYRENKFTGIEAMFEFPFCNDDLIEPLLEMSNFRNKTTRNILYGGDHETGVIISIELLGETGDIGIYNVTSNEALFLSIAKIKKRANNKIVKGDKIIICTEFGKKSAKLYREDGVYNILNSVSKDSKWLTIDSGDNMFSYAASANPENIEDFKIENAILYEGM
jgi:hypothetical protein